MATTEEREDRERNGLLENDDEEEETEDEDEETEEEEETDAPSQQTDTSEAPKPKAKRRRRRNRDQRIDSRPTWADGVDTSSGIEAEFAWPELLTELKSKRMSEYDVSIRVVRVDPPPVAAVANFDGSSVTGDATLSPGDHLTQYVDDNVHLVIAKGPAVYILQFVAKRGGRLLKRGRLVRPHPDEIVAFRRAKMNQPQPMQNAWPQQQGPGMIPPGYQAQMPQAPYGYAGGWGPGPSPQQGAMQNDEAAQLRAELARERERFARLEGQTQEIVKALKEGRTPNVATAPETDDERTARIVAMALRAAGVGTPGQGGAAPAAAAVGAGSPPPVTPPSPKEAVAQATDLMSSLETLLGVAHKLRKFGKSVDTVFSSEPIEAKDAEVLDKEEDEKKSLPWEGIEVAEAKLFGHQVKYPRNKETGKFDWEGFAMENPGIIEQGISMLSKIVDPLAELAKRAAAAGAKEGEGAAEVVNDIPADAKDVSGGGGGGGWPSSV